MNTFLPYADPARSAAVLDRQRLGKQRVEAIQIAKILVEPATTKPGWRNHPAVRMWRGWEPFLVKRYIPAMLAEWEARGYQNDLCIAHGERLLAKIGSRRSRQPGWFGEPIELSHRSNLVRKLPAHYKQFWPEIPTDLPYVWPV